MDVNFEIVEDEPKGAIVPEQGGAAPEMDFELDFSGSEGQKPEDQIKNPEFKTPEAGTPDLTPNPEEGNKVANPDSDFNYLISNTILGRYLDEEELAEIDKIEDPDKKIEALEAKFEEAYLDSVKGANEAYISKLKPLEQKIFKMAESGVPEDIAIGIG